MNSAVIKKLTTYLGCGIVAALTFTGCATSGSSSHWQRTGDPVVDGRTAISQGPAKDKVLWQYRTALVALRKGNVEEAKPLLDDALLSLGSSFGTDKSAKKARSYFSEESKKAFRGEPYERVMAYYYRGILYWMEGEPDNARACFRSAQLQDSDTENKEYASDYVLLEYLDALATAKLGGDGADAFQRAQKVCKSESLPPLNPKANTLFFLEFGQGPTKYATGEYKEQLRIHPGHSNARAAQIKVAGQTIRAGAYDDLSYQATTRGGRVMDHILANKAVFKTSTDTAGNAALIGGVVLAQNRHTQEAALGLLAFGLVSKIVAASTTPAADTRAWDNLPQHLSFAALQLPPGQHNATIEFLDALGRPIASMTKNVTVNVPASGPDTVIFVSDRS